jgi:hypothetical protein
MVGHQRIATARESIKQRGLANIGAPDKGNYRNHGIKNAAGFNCGILL